MTVPHMVEFMAVSSYGVGKFESSGSVQIALDLKVRYSQYHVLLVEDIIDSGNTIASVLELLSTLQAQRAWKSAPCWIKQQRRKFLFPSDIQAFPSPTSLSSGMGWMWMSITATCLSSVLWTWISSTRRRPDARPATAGEAMIPMNPEDWGFPELFDAREKMPGRIRECILSAVPSSALLQRPIHGLDFTVR